MEWIHRDGICLRKITHPDTNRAQRGITSLDVANHVTSIAYCTANARPARHTGWFKKRKTSSKVYLYTDILSAVYQWFSTAWFRRINRVVQKRIPSFIFGITSVIQHRFQSFFHCYKQKFMARKRDVLPPTTPLSCDHITTFLNHPV